MLGRVYAVVAVVLFVLPGVLLVDALVRPAAAWTRIGRRKWRWCSAFLAAPALSYGLSSFVPAVLVVPFSAYYMARVRTLLDVSTGLVLAERGRTVPSAGQREALAPLLVVPPALFFLGVVWSNASARERLVAVAISASVVVAAIVATYVALGRDGRDGGP